MRVELRRSGGIAATITARPITLDTDQLDPATSDRVCRLVDDARRCSPVPEAPPAGAADLIRYTLTITEDPGTGDTPESLSFCDPVPDPVDALVAAVLQLGEVRAP
jgi:Emfourin